MHVVTPQPRGVEDRSWDEVERVHVQEEIHIRRADALGESPLPHPLCRPARAAQPLGEVPNRGRAVRPCRAGGHHGHDHVPAFGDHSEHLRPSSLLGEEQYS